ncbi:unnamed protein product [Caenorhabditis angaria]|uniref:THAP-type domain-containing protein n=1 Tax=Caenorhabditis angaria TaxID=860376 RepID=A0A9P1I793_9PELO|nr:unnamed protein product [Caenorhabditis angaria]
MTFVPKSPHILEKWIRILGEEFRDEIKKNKVINMICLTHFDLPENSRKRGANQLPKLKNGAKNRMKCALDFEIGSTRQCQYCRKSINQGKMTHIPKSPKILEKWVEILGEQFLENVKKNNGGMICLTHFDLKPGKMNRGARNLPKKMENEEKNLMPMLSPSLPPQKIKTEQISPVKVKSEPISSFPCRFCGMESIEENSMTEVPINHDEIMKWLELLGAQFSANLIQHCSPHFVCSIHLKNV